MARLTRREMLQAIAEGGSVLVNGQIISRAEDLPTEAQLAKGDAGREAAVEASLNAEIAALEAQRDELKKGKSGR